MKKDGRRKTSRSVQDLLDRTRQKLRRILEQAQDEVRATVRKLDELQNSARGRQARAGLNQIFERKNPFDRTILSQDSP
jgi:F0F1-type ATP synthase membrane subunit b/b'